MSRQANVFVIGLDETNVDSLRHVRDRDRYRIHGLLTVEELQHGEIEVVDLLAKAEQVLTAFDGPIDAIVGYWDFPVSTMLPLLQKRFGVRGAPLEAVLKCEHKYWSRLEQAEVITEYPPFALVEPDDDDLPEGVDFPFWLKPVKSFSSEMAFEIRDEETYRTALAEIRERIGRVGEPFQDILDQADLPPRIVEAGGQVCLAEAALSGARAAVEGYSLDGEVVTYGVLDSLIYPGVSSFLRHQYPSQLPEHTQRRLCEVSRKVIAAIGLDPATFSIEFFCDPETDRVWLLEINPRHSQAHAELFAHVDGVSNHHCMLKVGLGEDPEMPRGQGDYGISARWYLRHFSDGVLERAPGADDIARVEREMPGIEVTWKVPEGARLSECGTHDSYSYPLAEIVVGARDEQDLVARYERCIAALDYRVREDR